MPPSLMTDPTGRPLMGVDRGPEEAARPAAGLGSRRSTATSSSTSSSSASRPAVSPAGTGCGVGHVLACVGTHAALLSLVCCTVESDPRSAGAGALGPQLSIHMCAAAGFAVLAFQLMVNLFVSAGPAELSAHLPALGCALMGFVSYATSACQISPVLISPSTGFPVHPSRSLTWAFTTSLIIFSEFNSAANPTGRLITSLLANLGMILTGLVANLSTGRAFWANLSASILLFLVSGVAQWQMFDMLVEETNGLVRSRKSVKRVRMLLVVIWTAFPLAFLAQECGFVFLAELGMVTADICAKGVLAAALAQGVLSTVSDRKQVRLQQMAHSLVVQLTGINEKVSDAVTSELLTPLSGMVRLTSSVLHTYGGSMHFRCRQAMATVCDMGQRFEDLLGDILSGMALQPDADCEDAESLDLSKVARETVVLMERLVSSGTKISLALPSDLAMVRGNYSRMMQLMFNVLGGAAKSVSRGTITLSAQNVPGIVHLDIHASGLPRRRTTKTFKSVEDACGKASTTLLSAQSAWGGDLTLAEKLVKAQRGQLILHGQSAEGVGLTLLLPAVPAAAIAPEKLEKKPARPSIVEKTAAETVHHDLVEKEPLVFAEERSMRRSCSHSSISSSGPHRAMPRSCSHASVASTASEPDVGALARYIGSKRASSCHLSSIQDSERTPSPVAANPEEMSILSIGPKDPRDLEALQQAAEVGRFELILAQDAEDALDILQSVFEEDGDYEGFPSAVLMDQSFGRSDGSSTIESLRTLFPQSSVPVIMLCDGISNELWGGLREGCTDFLCKPLEPAQLLARMAVQVRGHRRLMGHMDLARQSSEMLQEILPSSVIERLNNGQRLIADKLEEVTVVVSGIVGFEERSASVSSSEIITMLDQLFCRLDALTDKHGIQKVETVGDTYVILCGHDQHSEWDHAACGMYVAQEIQTIAREVRWPDGQPVQVRVGVHSGPVHAGVVGYKGARYCLFGGTVSAAGKMESSAPAGRIQVSESTTRLVAASGIETSFLLEEVAGTGDAYLLAA